MTGSSVLSIFIDGLVSKDSFEDSDLSKMHTKQPVSRAIIYVQFVQLFFI